MFAYHHVRIIKSLKNFQIKIISEKTCFLGIAVADVMVMLEYIPFVVHMNLLDEVNWHLLKGLYLSDQQGGRYCRFFTWKVINSVNF